MEEQTSNDIGDSEDTEISYREGVLNFSLILAGPPHMDVLPFNARKIFELVELDWVPKPNQDGGDYVENLND
ncbi:hypothetical protein U9M48_008188 [Paspalum notatum var. saurae]|uniref:Uncharacterized protein n=1 Tax=Paspalum notatum var. saurae TaxID=547442 RepID=A0AAQ3WCS9_PASNO